MAKYKLKLWFSNAEATLSKLSVSCLSPRAGGYLIAIFALITYAVDYWEPSFFIWDEAYHIASAEKYLNGTYFMELHPPLGKLVIAAGEVLLRANPRNDHFLSVLANEDYAGEFSFVGYRLFPVVFAVLAALLLYELFLRLFHRCEWAILLTFLYVFDNALIVQSRIAVLESTQICFVIATLLCGLALCQSVSRKAQIHWAARLGCAFALALATKVTSLFLLPGAGALLWCLRRKRAGILGPSVVCGSAFFLVYAAVWYTHFFIATSVNPELKSIGFLDTRPATQELLVRHESDQIENLPIMYAEALHFFANYNLGLPVVNLCGGSEMGSPPYFWPLGARTIPYHAEDEDEYYTSRYIYLQVNPMVWLCSLVGVLTSSALLFGAVCFGLWKKLPHRGALLIFLMLYWGYMGAMLAVPRVMYLYHYLIPLILGMILFATVLSQISRIGPFDFSLDRQTKFLRVVSILVITCFIFYSPLSYYQRLSRNEVAARAWFPLWDLYCRGCSRTKFLAFPLSN